MNIFRSSTVAVSEATRWKLTRIVKTQSNGELDVPLNVDALAEQVLTGWITHNHPKLDECWKRREAADAEAEASIKAMRVRESIECQTRQPGDEIVPF